MNRIPYPSLLTPPSTDDSGMTEHFMVGSPTFDTSPRDCMMEIDDLLGPHLEITEQPAEKFRFRYKSEMAGTHGSITGMTSDRVRKPTYPTVVLKNYDGASAIIRCSLYQYNARDSNNMPHAHRLIKKKDNQEVDDPHEIVVTREIKYTACFHSMGIIHTAKKNISGELIRKKTALKKEELARDGIFRDLNLNEQCKIKREVEEESKSINLNIVCLKFEAFEEAPNKVLKPICKPVFSHGINNLKSALTGELKIVRMDHCTSSCKGGKEIFILVEKVTKKNIKIRFFEEDDQGNVLWEDYGKFSDIDVHHQYAIVFKTPPYKDTNLAEKRKVYLDLVRPSDNAHSVPPLEFTYIPADLIQIGAKRARTYTSSSASSRMSSLNSGELPVTILDNLSTTDMPKIDSDDFRRALKDLLPSYQSEQESFAVDTPRRIADAQGPTVICLDHKTEKPHIEDADREYCIEVCKQLNALIKTRPKKQKIIDMVNICFDANKAKFPLHTAILLDDSSFVDFILKVIRVFEQKYILNMPNNYGFTPLHLAIQYDNFGALKGLLECGASPSIVDGNGNTALHMAVKSHSSYNILQKLTPILPEYIDEENNDGHTPLNLALEFNNTNAITCLIKNGANVNKPHKKDGYTPLRMAVEKQNIGCVRFLLNTCSNIDITKSDFNGINPVQLAKKLASQSPLARDVYRSLEKYATEKGIQFDELSIKEEESTDDEMQFDMCDIKSEPYTSEDLAKAYGGFKGFTELCLDEISAILDRSGAWEDLAKLLDLDYMIRGTDMFEENPSKNLLVCAVANKESLFQIREFLEHLDEKDAVKVMDTMVMGY